MDDVITSPSFSSQGNYGSSVSNTGNTSPYLKYGLILLLLAFLGFNIFTYLGNITQFFADIFGPIVAKIVAFFGVAAAETTKKAVEVTAKGVKTGVDVAATTVTTSADVVQKAVTGGYRQTVNGTGQAVSGAAALDLALNRGVKTSTQEPEPDDSASSIQSTTAKKSGYCFVGESKGIRSCVKVTEIDKCMSGDIFPTRDICINPTLRE
jgi:hypothetical protein